MIWLLLACIKPTTTDNEQSVATVNVATTQRHYVYAQEAQSLIADASRGGPALRPDQAPLPPFTGVERSRDTYVGNTICGSCHAEAQTTWKRSAHAHAIDTLTKEKRAHDPSCLRCHTTGFLHPGSSLNNDTANVGCESCHGPASGHIQQPLNGYGKLPKSGAACVACHTLDNSPDFMWESYWPSIAH